MIACMSSAMAEIDVRRAAGRFRTVAEGVETWHSFAYGRHYDPANVGFGPLRAVNEEIVEPGRGYDAHRHAHVEIVTWVLEGVLRHADSTGVSGDIAPGRSQRLSAGSGVEHVEQNASADRPLRFVQMMLEPDGAVAEPSYGYVDIPFGEGWHDAVGVADARARLVVGRWGAGTVTELPPAVFRHVHVTRGSARVAGDDLGPGDCARITGDDAVSVEAYDETELLVWLFAEPRR